MSIPSISGDSWVLLVENQLINPENHQMVDEDGGSQGESRVPIVAGGHVFLFLYSGDIPIRCAQLFICIHTHTHTCEVMKDSFLS